MAIAAIIVLNAFVFLLYYKNDKIQQSSDWVQHTYEVMAVDNLIFGSLQDMSTAQRGYLLSGREDFLEPYRGEHDTIEWSLDHLASLISDNQPQVARVAELKRLIHDQQQIMQNQIERYSSKSSVSPLTIEDILASKRNTDQIRKLTQDILTEEQRLLNVRIELEKQQRNAYTITIFLSSLISIAALTLACVFLYFINAKKLLAEKNLQQSEERFALALEGMQDGIFDWFPQDDRLYLSPRLKDMLGESDATMPDDFSELKSRVHPDDLSGMKAKLESYCAHDTPGEAYLNIFRLRHRSGSYRWIMSRGTGIWKDGAIKRLIGAHTDITDQRQFADNLKRMNEELETFTYIASHDLRSPLVNLKGFAGEMQIGLDELMPVYEEARAKLNEGEQRIFERVLKEDIPDALGFIKSSVVKMDRLTNGILELSRIGRRVLRTEPIDIPQVVEHALGALAHQIHEKGIEVTIGELPSVASDPLSVEQVIGNLIDNAIKYLDPKRPGKIRIAGERMGDVNFYRVEDNGRGIAEADLQKIFEIFRRAGNNEGIAGEGMGMAYVKATLRRLGGTIWCESVLGQGTTFFFTVPDQISTSRSKK